MSMKAKDEPLLKWNRKCNSYDEARLGTPDDGVLFTLSHYPTCYRRGPWRLLIEVCSGENHVRWGCFDDQDQPMRWFHKRENALSEAEAIAKVLWADRYNYIVGINKLKKGFDINESHTS